ncbi:MAG: PEP-CTERM sorting domain-containing protein [Armatimonadetes bacterium]|nr:PEP-CTERM sorting domain-containing protein [Armatimonadota bacterium]
MRFFALACAACVLPSAALASFDLVFVADVGTDSIHRFDADSGVYLGSMGAGALTDPNTLVVDQTNNRLIVGAVNGIFTYDLWTGTMMGYSTITVSNHMTQYSAGKYLTSWNGNYSWLGSLTEPVNGYGSSTTVPSSSQWGAITMRSSTNLLALNSTTGVVYSLLANTFNNPTATLGTYNATAAGMTGQIAAGFGGFVLASGLGNQINYATFSTSYGSTLISQSLGEFSTVYGVGFGHNSVYYAAGRNAANTSGLLTRRALGGSSVIGTFGNGILQNPRDIAVIAAPEPGAYVAFGLGLAGLALRRRRSVKK